MDKVLVKTSMLRIEFKLAGMTAVVSFTGYLNEEFRAADVLAGLDHAVKNKLPVSLELGGVERINSPGLKEWLTFMPALQKTNSCRFSLLNTKCISYANTVTDFLGKPPVPVDSLELPYHCPKCELDALLVVKTRELKGDPIAAPAVKCEKCGGQLEFDDLVTEYFSFLSAQKVK